MNLRFAVLLLLMTLSHTATAQHADYIDYFRETSSAKYHRARGNTDSALRLLTRAFNRVDYVYAYDRFIYAWCLYKAGRSGESYAALVTSIRDGFPLVFVDTTDFPRFFADAEQATGLTTAGRQFRDDLKTTRKLITDSCMYFMINEMYYADQNGKEMALAMGRKYIDTSLGAHARLEELFLQYVLRNGWMSYRQCGKDYLLACGAHLSGDKLDVLVPFLKKELHRGNITPEDYAFIHEKLLAYREKENFSCYYNAPGWICQKTDWPKILRYRAAIGMSLHLDGGDYIFSEWKTRGALGY